MKNKRLKLNNTKQDLQEQIKFLKNVIEVLLMDINKLTKEINNKNKYKG